METVPKKFHVFTCDQYYPSGGLSDLVGSFETEEKAIEVAKESRYDYAEVVTVDSAGDLYVCWSRP